MIGVLPTSLDINGRDYEINTDFRIILMILAAMVDEELDDNERAYVMLELLYDEIPEDTEEAMKQAAWFIDGGRDYSQVKREKPVMDWEQDEELYMAAISKLCGGKDIRLTDYMHWWSFLGLFGEIQDGKFAQIVNIRAKLNSGKDLDKTEKKFYKDNKKIIDIPKRLTREEKAEKEAIERAMRGE
jgi:hypothetical protein